MVILWDIGKQHSPRCDAAERGVPSGAILFAQRNFIENEIKIAPNTPKNESGLTQMIMIGKSNRQIWVNLSYSRYGLNVLMLCVIHNVNCTLVSVLCNTLIFFQLSLLLAVVVHFK